MTDSTCRDCAVRHQVDEIKEMLRFAMGLLVNDDLEKAYKLIAEVEPLLATLIDIKREL